MWTVEIGDEFDPELTSLSLPVQDQLAILVRLLKEFGPLLQEMSREEARLASTANSFARPTIGSTLTCLAWPLPEGGIRSCPGTLMTSSNPYP